MTTEQLEQLSRETAEELASNAGLDMEAYKAKISFDGKLTQVEKIILSALNKVSEQAKNEKETSTPENVESS